MKRKFETPEVEVLEFKSEDVILTDSNDGDVDIDPWKSDFLGGR